MSTGERPASAQLGLDEGVELAHAWCEEIARSAGVHSLIIKGPAMTVLGLRPALPSGDVDVLVAPSEVATLVRALRERGWYERAIPTSTALLDPHAITLSHPQWPNDIDVHYRYPGFTAETTTAFDVLWSRRITVEIAHARCTVSDKLSSVLILALHALRSDQPFPRRLAQIDALVSRVELDSGERADLARLAHDLGCAATLSTVLTRFGLAPLPSAGELASAQLADWKGLQAAEGSGTYRWLVAIRRAPFRERIRLTWHALWPTSRDIALEDPHSDTGSHLLRLRWRLARLRRGLRGVPRTLRTLAFARVTRTASIPRAASRS